MPSLMACVGVGLAELFLAFPKSQPATDLTIEPTPETQDDVTPTAPHDLAQLAGGFASQGGEDQRIAEMEDLSRLDSEEEVDLGDPAGLFDEPRDLSNDGSDQE